MQIFLDFFIQKFITRTLSPVCGIQIRKEKNMKNFITVFVFLTILCCSSCSKEGDELWMPQELSSEGVGVHPMEALKYSRLPVTSWNFSGIDQHTFYGINGDDFYVLSVFHNSTSTTLPVYVVEYDSSGNAIGGQTMSVPPRRTITKTYWTNNNVYSVEVEIRTPFVSGGVSIASGNRN